MPSATPSATVSPPAQTQRSPERAATPAPPSGLLIPGLPGATLSGTIRAYDFNRQNVPQFRGNNPNREAFNFGGDLRLEYKIEKLPLTIGTAYWGADPLGLNGNNTILKNTTRNGGIDNTLPGFQLSTFEYYLRYNDAFATATIGAQSLNRAWAPASDSRIKPALYQAIDISDKLSPLFSVNATRVIGFESRTDSLFDRNTLLTSTPAGASGLKTVSTAGLLRVAGTYTAPGARLTATAEYNAFYDIANLGYGEAKYNIFPSSRYKPFVAAQYVREIETGGQVIGIINNETYGLQFGATPAKNLVFTASVDGAPWHYATFSAASLKAATSFASANYVLPSGGTGEYLIPGPPVATATVQSLGNSLYRVAYGGIASPYSDSYATDPLYTTSISQGMVDRRSAGLSYKGALTYTTTDKRFIALVSEAAYVYDTQYARNRTSEFNADLTYNFNAVRSGPYRGFSLRERFADRSQPLFPNFPQNFKYFRHQLQFSF